MRSIAPTLLFALLLCTATAWSQSVKHPDNPDAVPLGKFTTKVTTASPQGKTGKTGSLYSGGTSDIAVTIITWRNGSSIDYFIDASSVKFQGGTESWINETNTIALFDLIAQTAISQGLLLGYATCPENCTAVFTPTRVYSPACVTRTGSGFNTQFTACGDESYCVREYEVCCPNGLELPKLTRIYHEGGSGACGGDGNGGCEPTCP